MSQDLNNVRRKINEIMKKEDGRTVVGWRPGLNVKREEGEVWETLDGRKWTIKNGVTQTVTKLDGAKTPWFCPQCTKSMPHRLDTKFWRLRGKCMDCVIKDETEIRRQGKWEEYEQQILKENYRAHLVEAIMELHDYHATISNPEFIYADDYNILLREKWDVDLGKIKSDIMADIAILQQKLDDFDKEYGAVHENTTDNT
jgi:hypothetical protein